MVYKDTSSGLQQHQQQRLHSQHFMAAFSTKLQPRKKFKARQCTNDGDDPGIPAVVEGLQDVYAALEPYLVEEQPTPNLPIVRAEEGCMKLEAIPGKGQGWRAARDIPAGTTVLCEKPFAVLWEWQMAVRPVMIRPTSEPHLFPCR